MNLRLLRGLAGATTLALLAGSILIAPALAANQRDVYFGSPPTTDPPQDFGGGYNEDGTLDFGELVNSDAVTVGKKAATTLLVRNDGGQQLNHVKIAGGLAADDKPFNPLFLPPDLNNDDEDDPSLPGDASIAKIIVLSGSATCNPDAGVSFECTLGSLAPDAWASFLIVVNVPTVADEHSYWVTGSWNEGWSSTGNNADYNFAVGTLDVQADSCTGGTASYFLGTEGVTLGDGGEKCFGANAEISSDRPLSQNPDFPNGGHASVVVDNGQGAPCPTAFGFKCFGSTVSVSIIDGNSVPGGVEWKVTWDGTKTLKGVIHYEDGYVAGSSDFVAIAFTKANKCNTTTKTTDCWVSAIPSAGNLKPPTITVTFVTDGNGKGGGFN